MKPNTPNTPKTYTGLRRVCYLADGRRWATRSESIAEARKRAADLLGATVEQIVRVESDDGSVWTGGGG